MKKKLLLAGIAAIIVAGGTAGAFMWQPKVAKSDFDLQGLNQQVQNHEARITNNEKDIAQLQQNTNTPAAPDHVSVPAVTAQPVTNPAPTDTSPAPQPAPVMTKITYSVVNQQCIRHITWSDGHIEDSVVTIWQTPGAGTAVPSGCESLYSNTVTIHK